MIITLCTCPDKKTADTLAVQIVGKEFAACVNIIQIENSVYRWKGKVESHPEYLLIIKTTKKAYAQLEAFIKQHHPNETPEIIYINVDGGNANYLQWVDANTLSRLLTVPLDLRATKRASKPLSEDIRAKKPSTW